jgi:hydrogenase nickel incorporation protein HypA/HybF
MHELSVMAYLLETVEEQARAAGAQRVLAINLVVGERTSFVDDSLLFYFDQLTPGRLSAGARLNIRRQPMTFRCAACAITFAPAAGHFRCPACGALGQLTEEGRELLIESVEVET